MKLLSGDIIRNSDSQSAYDMTNSPAVTAGTNAQGQGALTSDMNVVTTAAANPSGVTLPVATAGRNLFIVNKGANPINVYPASGGVIDALAANAAVSIPVGGVVEFAASSTTQWYSTLTVTASGGSIKGVTFNNYTETVVALNDASPVLDPNNGPIQTWTLGASRTPTQANWAAGQSILLMIDDGTAFTITWTTLAVVWKTNSGAAPTLALTGYTPIVLWKVGAVIYGARVGNA